METRQSADSSDIFGPFFQEPDVNLSDISVPNYAKLLAGYRLRTGQICISRKSGTLPQRARFRIRFRRSSVRLCRITSRQISAEPSFAVLIVENAGITSVVQVEHTGSTDEGQNRTDGDLGINAGKPLFIARSKAAFKMSQTGKIKNAGQIIFCKAQAVSH